MLDIDNNKQTIQGIKIKDRKMFLDMRTIVEAEYLEGWRPAKQDIQKLLNHANRKEIK